MQLWRKKKLLLIILAVLVAVISPIVYYGRMLDRSHTSEMHATLPPANSEAEVNTEGQGMKESTEITWIMPCDSIPLDSQLLENEVTRQLEGRINVRLNIKWINWNEYISKLNVIAASNEAYDICWNSNWQSLYQLISRNAYMDITELIPQYAPDFAKLIPEHYWEVMRFNGRILCVPNLQKASTKHGLYVRKDINEKYDVVETVHNLDDLDKVFARIKKDNPQIYCILKPKHLIDYSLIWSDWDYISSTGIGVIDMKEADATGKIKLFNALKRPEYREQLDRAKRWYENGYCPKDAPIIEDENIMARNGQVVFLISQLGPWAEKDIRSIFLGSEYNEWIPLDIAVGRQVIQTQDILGSVQCINVNSSNPEKAMMFINLVNTDQLLYNTLCNGIQGKDWLLKDGYLEYPQGTTPENSRYYPDCAWAFGNLFNLYPGKSDGADFFDRMRDFEKNAVPSPIFGFNFDPSPVKNELAQISAIVEYSGALYNGANDTEQLMADYCATLDKAGADKLLAEQQRQLDKWLASKK